MQQFELAFRGLNSENLGDYTDILTSTKTFDLSTHTALGCQCNGKPCGLAVVRRIGQSCAELVWIEVLGGLRRRGIGRTILETMEKCLAAMGTEQITAAYSSGAPYKNELEAFLDSCDYSAPVLTQKVFFADFEDVRSEIGKKSTELLPQMEDKVQLLAKLSPKTERALKTAVEEKRIPAFVLPQNAVGELLADYSMAYTEAQNVCAAVMYSALPDLLYLNALYINRNHRREGEHLMFYTLDRALHEYREADTLAVDAINTQSNALVNHFAAKMPHFCERRLAMRKKIN